MNYYPHHIGDYSRDTAHLSMTEDGAYRRLLDICYASEKPLPIDGEKLYRLARARSRAEKAAVDIVLSEFFIKDDGGWRHRRVEEEIARASESGEESRLKKENEKERQRRHRARRRELYSALREHGQVPKWDATTDELETLLRRISHAPVTRDNTVTDICTQRLSISQEPIANNQEPNIKTTTLSGKPDGSPEFENIDRPGLEALPAIGPVAELLPETHEQRDLRREAREILAFLNAKTGRRYEDVPANLNLILARLKDGSTPVDCRQVIAKKCREWIGDAKMNLYLRPATLFNRTNFAQYKGELGT